MHTTAVTDRFGAANAEEQTTIGNEFGHFSADGKEFIVTDHNTPRPWANIIANSRMGLAVTQTGSGFTWIDNSQLGTITRWQQDLVRDSSGKFLFVRDAATGELWSAAPAPVLAQYTDYACHHGLGYTTFRTGYSRISIDWTLFCPPDKTVELWLVQLTNNSSEDRRLELCPFLEWSMGVTPDPRREFHKLFIETWPDLTRSAVFARNHMWDVPSAQYGHWNTDFAYTAALASTAKHQSMLGDKQAFFGRYRNPSSPVALSRSNWPARFGRHEDPIAAIRNSVTLAAGDTTRIGYVLAVGSTPEETEGLIDSYRECKAIENALVSVRDDWQKRLAKQRITTPDKSLDCLANDWLRYQVISSRIWGRCGYYQQSGAYGFRDQLQDSQIWLPIEPERCRQQINMHAKHQFADGSVHHWWHPLSEQGLITTMTDDLLWLGFVTANYIKETGDLSVLQDQASFLNDAAPASILEHVNRAFARVFRRTSPRGIPLIGAGDWNDGLSAVGIQEKGESFWLGHFLVGLLIDWAEIYDRVERKNEADDFRAKRNALIEAINKHGWDGNWYARATRDDGTVLGSAKNEFGRIFLNAQTWAILNDVAPPDRAQSAMAAVEEHLVTDIGTLLLTPAFCKPDETIGYITRYAPGLRENGGVYTHAACWAIAAACKTGNAALAGRMLNALNPTRRSPEAYWAEPYVTPGNIDGPESPYFGRGGWTWYTGSAAWLQRVITDWVLGVRAEWDGLRVQPCLPPDWQQACMDRPFRGSDYHIEIVRGKGRETGTLELTMDGRKLADNLIPPSKSPGKKYNIVVEC